MSDETYEEALDLLAGHLTKPQLQDLCVGMMNADLYGEASDLAGGAALRELARRGDSGNTSEPQLLDVSAAHVVAQAVLADGSDAALCDLRDYLGRHLDETDSATIRALDVVRDELERRDVR